MEQDRESGCFPGFSVYFILSTNLLTIRKILLGIGGYSWEWEDTLMIVKIPLGIGGYS